LAENNRTAGISMKEPGKKMRVKDQRISFSDMPAFEGSPCLRR
jgi:hypothetical protein